MEKSNIFGNEPLLRESSDRRPVLLATANHAGVDAPETADAAQDRACEVDAERAAFRHDPRNSHYPAPRIKEVVDRIERLRVDLCVRIHECEDPTGRHARTTIAHGT